MLGLCLKQEDGLFLARVIKKACKTPSSSYWHRPFKKCITWELWVKFYLGQNAAWETAFQWALHKCNCYRHCHTKWIESEKREISWHPSYMDSKKKWYRLTHRLREQTCGYWGKRWREGTVREFGMDMDTLLYVKWITNNDLPYNTGNSTLCRSLDGRGYMYIHGWAP